MSRNTRTAAQVRRELSNLELRLRRGEINTAQHGQLSDKLIQELNGLAPAPSEYLEDAEILYDIDSASRDADSSVNRMLGAVYGAKIFTGTSTRELTAAEWARFREVQMTGMFDWGSGGFFGTRDDQSVAEQAWDEHGGVVMCECESMNCELVIDIAKDEYLKASTPGYRRLTHPNCGYGIIGSKLVGRSEKWHIWDKGY